MSLFNQTLIETKYFKTKQNSKKTTKRKFLSSIISLIIFLTGGENIP